MRKILYFILGLCLGGTLVFISACSSAPVHPMESDLDRWLETGR
jgi:hypothetical protein